MDCAGFRDMDAHTLEKLQFDVIRERVADGCATPQGRALVCTIRPSASLEHVRQWLAEVNDMIEVVPDHGWPPLIGMRDIIDRVSQSGRPDALSAQDLADVHVSLALTGPTLTWLSSVRERSPLLGRFAGRMTDLTPVANHISRAIDARGEVLDGASEKLATIRRSIDAARREINNVFERMLKQRRYVKLLQYGSTTFHNDRLVLPLKAEHRGRIPGIVHRSSDSGSTLFIEPAPAVELNNSIIKLRARENEEIGRILFELIREVHRHEDEIIESMRVAAIIDMIAAKARYALKRNALCPEVNDRGILDLHGARHPVLLELFSEAGRGEQVVPIDIRVGDDFDLLVVTGPNTGGKTVSLKTAGLLAVMTQAGIPIPVDPGSTLPVYKHICLDVGDEQSLEQSLSTFSAHLSNLLAILQRAGKRTLVLLDELGSGTDPDEGSAIGHAVMDELLERGCTAIITTHLSQLKAVAYQHDRVDNACAEFDVQSLQPTYKLRIGEPGNSKALAIARRLGLPDHMVKRAEAHLAGQSRALSRAIEGTIKSRRDAESARKEARQAQLAAQKSQEQYEEQAEALRRAGDAQQKWAEWIGTLQPGDTVFLKSFDKPARVVRMQLHRQTAVVSTGALDLEVQINTLSQPRSG